MKHKLAITGIVLLAFVLVTSVTVAGVGLVQMVANNPTDKMQKIECDANGYLLTTNPGGDFTWHDCDTGAGTDDIQEVSQMFPAAGGGVPADVGAGNVGAGTQRVTLAADDPGVALLGTIDADTSTMASWDDGADNANVNIQAVSVTAIPISDDANANTETNPMYHQPIFPVFDDDNTANCVAITNASVQFTLPANDGFEICAHGNTAYILCNANPTATTAVGNYSFMVGDGQCKSMREYGSAKCAVIATATNGSICFEALDYN